MTVFTFPAIQVSTAGLATEAEQQAQTALLTTIDANIVDVSNNTFDTATNTNSIDGKTPNLGQALMAGSVPVTIASNQSAVPVSGPLTDTQLRATAVPVSGPLTDAQLRATAVPVSGPLTDTQLRATAVSVSGPLTDAELRATAVPVSGPLTDTQLRATAVPVSAASLPLPTGAATEATLSALNAKVTAVDTGAVVVSSSALPTGAATSANQSTSNSWLSSIDSRLANQILAKLAGKSVVTTSRNDYTSTSVTTGAWVQLVASLGADVTELEIFDSSGQTLELGIGAAASESRLVLVFPGGNGRIPVAIASGARISIRAVSATANAGEIDINFYG